uniref:Uncharacterized protein n=2 Tax=Arion vulgaris TaxID=1028688 RepID=A0A0B7BPT9_9EUPU
MFCFAGVGMMDRTLECALESVFQSDMQTVQALFSACHLNRYVLKIATSAFFRPVGFHIHYTLHSFDC